MEKHIGIIHEDYVDSSVDYHQLNESDQHKIKDIYDDKCKNPEKGVRNGCSKDGRCNKYI